MWGEKWVIGGDFNDIKAQDEKEGGRKRPESSFVDFRRFIAEMEMCDIKFRGNAFTWENNRDHEGYIKERLDHFFGSVAWMEQYNEAKVKHIFRSSSDHYMLLLDTKPV